VTDSPEASGADGAAQEVTAEQQAATWVPQPPGALATQGSALIGPPDHPEFAVAGAFAGGVLAALILRRLAR
jgi:hypothetical protein